MKLLIVDDSMMLQERIAGFLMGIDNLDIVGRAENSVEAIKKINELQPDLILCDLRMNGGGGIELLEILKSRHPEIESIVYTNYPYPQYEEKCRSLGVKYFFHKTIDAEQLHDTVEQLCN